jgi:hypothetical protein
MIEFGGVLYYLDMDAFDKAITPPNIKPTDKIKEVDKKTVTNELGDVVGTEITETIRLRGKEIDGAKYDILRMMIEVIMEEKAEIDDTLGADRALEKTALSYKLAFNTLFRYGILKEQE